MDARGNPVRHAKRLLLAALGLVACASPAVAGPAVWGTASNVGRDILFAAALGVPAVQKDWQGDLQAGGSILLGGGIALGLKHVFPEERPDHSNRHSFPSGHSSEAFAAAASLENRYGWKAGLPAFALAAFVATARVEARKHHWYDSVAGAAIGTGSGFLLTRRHDDRIRLVPWGDSGGGGLSVSARF